MAEINEKHEGSTGFDPCIRTEDIGFSPGEMYSCPACGRMNPPNRIKCLYCGDEFEVQSENAAAVKLTLRRLESWENGFNLILPTVVTKPDTVKAAALLSLNVVDLLSILDLSSAIPIARVESMKAAGILIAKLAGFGLKCSVVSDASLDADKPPIRLRNIGFRDSSIEFTNFNTRLVTEMASNDLALIVPGILTSSKVESLEKKRSGKIKVLEETATAADESVLDLYSRRDPVGFRVQMSGFDFSMLGEEKALVASENMRRLLVRLKENSPKAKVVTDYQKVLHALGTIWEIEARRDPQGLQRSGFGKVEFGSVASTNNLRQFTKYSRLQWHLL
ncbi:MAG: hypothetical protein ACKVQJ_12995 [Pyrinomonadaceae bacterium]